MTVATWCLRRFATGGSGVAEMRATFVDAAAVRATVFVNVRRVFVDIRRTFVADITLCVDILHRHEVLADGFVER